MSFVTSTQEGPILTLTLNRPEALNALNAQVLDDLDAALDAVDLDTVRCLIFTGTGDKAFAAGADIAAMANMTPEEAAAFSRRGNEVFRRIETFPLPTVAAVNGYALGGGCELAMACDIRLCSENAVFGQPEVTLGITPGFGGTQRLMRLVGMGNGGAAARRQEARRAHRPKRPHRRPGLQGRHERGHRPSYGRGRGRGGSGVLRLLRDGGPEAGHGGLSEQAEEH